MNVKKIFMTLVTIVAAVLLGALLLNILMPNVTTTMIDASEDMVYKATGLKFDFNANGNVGSNTNNYKGATGGSTGTGTGIVDGFKK